MGDKKYLLMSLIAGLILIAGCDYYAQLGIEQPIVKENITEQIIEDIETPNEVPEEPEELIQELPEEPVVIQEPIGTGEEPKKTVIEGDLVSFPNLKAEDPDGDPITYTFSKPLNDKGEWQTEEGDAGEYKVIITASDGKSQVSQQVIIAVETKNKPPVMEELDDVAVKEGETVNLDLDVEDPEGEPVTVSYSGWMTSATKKAGFDEAGTYEVIITATDGKNTVSQTVAVTVGDVNRAPLLGELKDVTVKEGGSVEVDAIAADPDGDKVTISFGQPLDENGKWQTEEGDAGEYMVTVTASDGTLKDSKKFKISVESLNKAPVFTGGLGDISVKEGQTVTINPEVEDPEGDSITVSYSGWMKTSQKSTTYADAGEYDVVVTATDGKNTISKTIKVTVGDVNRPPEFQEGSFE